MENVKNFVKTLSRDEMKNVIAGSGGCQIAWRDADGGWLGYGGSCVSQEDAIRWYNEGHTNDHGDYVSGYCCDSCGDAGFENAPLAC